MEYVKIFTRGAVYAAGIIVGLTVAGAVVEKLGLTPDRNT